jgi:hypothetical protein
MYDAGENIEGYELAEEMPYEWEDLSDDEMRALIESAGNTFNAPLVETMTKLFVPPQQDEKQQEPESETDSEPVAESSTIENSSGDDRTFWQTYTPMNIIREVRFRLTGKA